MGIIHYLAGESTDRYQKAGLILRTLGWLSIAWGCITLMWVFSGIRDGSYWWLIWTIAQFVIGVIFIALATRVQARSAHFVTSTEVETRDKAA